jgi:hypothetical protein
LAKNSIVLQALNLLGLEDILKLSKILHVKQIARNKAVGEELIVWEETEDLVQSKPAKPKPADTEAKILEFPKVYKQETQNNSPEADEREETSTLISSDLVMWQRELGRQTGEKLQKRDAFSGYNRATEMLVSKETGLEGKSKNRIVATNGVLVNKKQA